MPAESIIIASLLHDACKADIYKPVIKRQKNASGIWEDKPEYDVDYTNFPLGHGEKSVNLLLKHGLKMTNELMGFAFPASRHKGQLQQNERHLPSPLCTGSCI